MFKILNRCQDLGAGNNAEVTEFHRRFEQLKQLLEGRLQLGSLYQQFHKFAKEVWAFYSGKYCI